MFNSGEIIKLINYLIGNTKATGESYTDEHALNNLKILIDVMDWCLDEMRYAKDSGIGRPEASMNLIGWTAACALDEWKTWLSEVTNE